MPDLGQHPHGVRLDDVRHICPDCGFPVKVFCPTCLGVGNITTGRLAQWQAEQNAKMDQDSR